MVKLRESQVNPVGPNKELGAPAKIRRHCSSSTATHRRAQCELDPVQLEVRGPTQTWLCYVARVAITTYYATRKPGWDALWRYHWWNRGIRWKWIGRKKHKILLSDLSLVPCSPCVINHVALCPSFGLLNVLCKVFSFCIVIPLHHYCVFILKNRPKAWSWNIWCRFICRSPSSVPWQSHYYFCRKHFKKKKMLQTNIITGNPVYVLKCIYEDYLTYQSTVDIWLV